MSQLNYDEMVQTALKQVVRHSLDAVANAGFPGNHHFYITFRTDHPHALVPDYLAEQHPEEITIVLQYQFWDLKTSDHGFEVTLSFNDIRERLVIPFAALTSFVDPSVKFGLQFVPNMEAGHLEPTRSLIDDESGDNPSAEPDGTGGNVIRLDSFRKK